MTDLSRFSDQQFDAVKWINTIISEVPDGESLDNHLTTISMKLHMVTQDYSEQLETAMIESMTSMPRMIGEIGRLEDQLRSVQKEMESIENNVRLADKRGLTGLEDLSRLDHLKGNMEKCKSTLEEYDQWNQVVREARQLLESGGVLSDTADRISSMFHSMEILKNLPGNEDRQENCQKFRTTLLDALRPNVQKELVTMNIVALQEYAYVFRKLGSDDEFKHIYTKQRPAHLLKLWSEIKQGESFSEWIALYLGTVGRFVQEEEEHISNLFGAEQLSNFYRSILVQTLDPLDKLLPSQLSVYNDVMIVFECYLVLEEFGRRNILTLEQCDASERWQLMDSVFSGLWKFVPNYIDIEERSLRRVLYQAMDSVSLSQAVQEYQEQSGLVGMDDIDPMEVISIYCDRLVHATQAVLQDILRFIDRVAQFFGGIAIKTALRAVANLQQTLIKSLALKIGNVALSLGVSDFVQGIISAGGGMFEPYASYLDENNFAQALSERIFASETSRQNVMAASLHAYKIAAQVLVCTATVDQRVRDLSLQVHQQVQWQQGLDWTSNKSITTLLSSNDSHSNNTNSAIAGGMNTSVGVWFGQWKLQRENETGSELRSFLATCPISAGTAMISSNSSGTSSSALHYQGIFSATQMLLQRLDMKTKDMILIIGTRQPEKMVAQYPGEDCWQRQLTPGTPETILEVQNQLLPLSVVTQMGEHLLSLVQDLESFSSNLESLEDMSTGASTAEDEATVATATMHRMAAVILATATADVNGQASVQALVEQCISLVAASNGWKMLKEKLVLADTKSLRQLSDRGQVSKLLTVFDKEVAALGLRFWSMDNDININNSSVMGGHDAVSETSVQVGLGGNYGEGAGFVNEWLMLFSDALIGQILSQTLQLPRPVSLYGNAQLLTDIDYFWNVVHATGVKPHPLFGHLKKILQLHLQHPGEIQKMLMSVSHGKSALVLKDLLNLYSSILQLSLVAL